MWYKNIAGRFFGLVTKHACDRETNRQTERRPIVAKRSPISATSELLLRHASDRQADRHTDRHAHRNTSRRYLRRSNNVSMNICEMQFVRLDSRTYRASKAAIISLRTTWNGPRLD